MRIITYLFLTLTLLFGVTFALLNSQEVTLNYYLNKVTLPFSLFIVVSFTVGVSLGILLSFLRIIRLRAEVVQLKSKLRQGVMSKPEEVIISRDIHT